MYTTQKQIRQAFWQARPNVDRRKITSYDGKGKMYKTDTRVAFCEFLDYLCSDGQISYELANRATLEARPQKTYLEKNAALILAMEVK